MLRVSQERFEYLLDHMPTEYLRFYSYARQSGLYLVSVTEAGREYLGGH